MRTKKNTGRTPECAMSTSLELSRAETWQWLLTHIPLAAEHMKQGKALGMTFEKPRVRKKAAIGNRRGD